MVSGSSKGQQVPKGRRDMGIPEGPAGQGLPHPGSIPLPPVRELGRLGAAGNSPLPWALDSSMGMSWGQAGMSAYRWGSGSGPVRGTRVKHSPVITRSTGRSWGVTQMRLFSALKADSGPQGPEVWCSLLIYQFRFCQCWVHVATTIKATPSVGSWICTPPDTSLLPWTLCSVLCLSS